MSCPGASDQPVLSPSTNQPRAKIPTAKTESPTIRSQRKVSIVGVCINSADRAYHVPCSTLAQVCINPTGSRLMSTIRASPTLIDQNANAKLLVRQV